MSPLDDLFENDRLASDAPRVPQTGATAQKLENLLGAHRRVSRPVRAHDDTPRLVHMVETADSGRPRVVTEVPTAGTRRRRRPRVRIDRLNALSAVIAVVVVVGAVAFAGTKAASASPADIAAQALAQDENALRSAQQGLDAVVERLTSDIATGLTEAQSTRTAVLALDENMVEGEGRSAVLAATDAYEATLGAIVVPEVPEVYEHPDIDEESLVDVAAALDEVRARSAAMDDSVTAIRALRAQVEADRVIHRQALSVFAASFVALADAEVARYPEADDELQEAVILAGSAVASSPLYEQSGQQALSAYQEAVRALRDDDRRARVEAEQAERQADRRTGDQGAVDPGEETEPVTDPEGGSPQP